MVELLIGCNVFVLAPTWLVACVVWMMKARWPQGPRVAALLLAIASGAAVFAASFALDSRTCGDVNEAFGIDSGGWLPMHCLMMFVTIVPVAALGGWVAFVIGVLALQQRADAAADADDAPTEF